MVKIRWIMDNEKRKTTLKRRLPALVKKAGELAVLCDVPVCLVAYPPGEAEPVVWPSPGAATDVLRQYRGLPDGLRNELDSTDLVKQMNDKLRVELSNVQLQCREVEIKNVIVDCLAGRRGSFDDLPIDFLVSLGMKVREKLQAVNARLQEIRSARALLPPPPPAPEDVQMVEPLAMTQPLLPPPMVAPLTSPLPQPQQVNFEVLDAFNGPSSDGSALPSTE